MANDYLALVFGARTSASPGDFAKPAAAPVLLPGGFELRPGYNRDEFRWGSRDAEIVDYSLTVDGAPTAALVTGRRMLLVLRVRFHRAVDWPIYGLTVKTPDGAIVFGGNSRDSAGAPIVRPASGESDVEVLFRVDQMLGPGEYLLSVGVSEQSGTDVIPLDRRYDAIHVTVENPASRSFGLAIFDMSIEINELELCA